MLPLFLDARLSLAPNEVVSPSLAFDVGYSLGLNKMKTNTYSYYNYSSLSNKGGVIINPAIGFKVLLSNNSSFIFNVGYCYQELKVAGMVDQYQYVNGMQQINRVDYSYKQKAGFITLRIGVGLN